MNIKMIGIDHGKASVDVRQAFAFTKKSMEEALLWIKAQKEVSGCVILSTCNRTELWANCAYEEPADLLDLLCHVRHLRREDYEDFFVEREGKDAAEHLFCLASGLKSKIVGEDQILGQVKDAVSFARERDCVDQVLDVLFRQAVTVGKLVKTQIPIRRANYSLIDRALEFLRERGHDVAGKNCLVIGNGEMGRLAAEALLRDGADVTMTLRELHSGVAQIPVGCRKVGYSSRYELMPLCKLIVSATTSPNYTITLQGLLENKIASPETLSDLQKRELLPPAERIASTDFDGKILLDLAVPPDIEAKVAELRDIALFGVDDFQSADGSESMKRQIEKAENLIQAKVEDFFVWYDCRDLVPRIQGIGNRAAKDAVWRSGKVIKGLGLVDAERNALETGMTAATAKVVSHLLFGLRDSLKNEVLRECIDALERVYPSQDSLMEDSLKSSDSSDSSENEIREEAENVI